MGANVRSANIVPGGGDLLVIEMKGSPPSPLLDGDFEKPQVANGTYTNDLTGSAWTSGGGAAFIGRSGTTWNITPYEGQQGLSIYDSSYVTQVVTLNAEQYQVAFQCAQWVGFNSSSQTIRVSLDGTTLVTANPASGAWSAYSATFTPTAGTHTFKIEGLSTTGNLAHVDALTLLTTAPVLPGPGGADVKMVSYSGGLTITPSGGSARALSPQCATALGFLWCPIDPVGNWEQIQDDTAATKAPSPAAWTVVTGYDNGFYGWHNSKSGEFNRFTRSYGNQHITSTNTSATATWTFTSVSPGTYSVLAIYQSDWDRTTGATYTVKDGATTIGTFAVNQQTTLRFDTTAPRNVSGGSGVAAAAGRRVMILGQVTIATGSSVTIQLSNTAGTGTLAANLAGLRRVIQPLAAGAVLNAPSGWCTTTAGSLPALVNLPVGTTDIDTFMPYDTAAARTLWRGYNVSPPSYGAPDILYADRMRMASKWGGNASTDADGNMTGNTGTAARPFLTPPIQNGFDGFALPTAKEYGTWTIKYVIVSGTPDVTIALDLSHGEVIGTHSTPTLVGGKWTRTVTVDSRGTVNPGSPSLRVLVTGGVANVEVYGPEVPSGWTSKFHPSLISWLQNRGFQTIRLDPSRVNFGTDVEWADMPHDGQSSTMWAHTTRTLNVTTIGPVNRTDLLPWYGAINGRCSVLITTSTPHGLRTGDTPIISGLSDDGNGWGITVPTGTAAGPIIRPTPGFVIVKTSTQFIFLGFGNNGEVDVTNANQCVTLTGSHSVTGSVPIEYGAGIPYADLLRLVNECNIGSYYFNLPISGSDDFATQFGALAATTLDAGKKLRIAVGNETWNNFLPVKQTAIIWEFHTQYLYANSLPGGANVGNAEGRAWLALRTGQIASLIKAQFTSHGRSASDVIVVLETCIADVGPTTQSLDYAQSHAIAIDELNPATYRAIVTDTGGGPSFGMGYTTDVAAGVAALSDASVPCVVWINQRYGALAGMLAGHQNSLNAHGYTTTKKGTYEGGQDYMSLWSPERAGRTFFQPLMYRAELSITQMLQSWGLAGECVYTLHYPNGPNDGAYWLTYRTVFMDAGTGISSENPNPHDMRPGETTATFGPGVLSQTGGAHRTWASPTATANTNLATTAGASTAIFRFVAFGDENMQFTTTDRNGRLDVIKTSVGAGGSVKIYTGAPPGVAAGPSGTLLVSLPNLAFGTSTGGALTFSADATPGAQSGTPGYGRLVTSGGTAKVEFTCAVGSGEANFSATISSGGTVTLSSATITEGNA